MKERKESFEREMGGERMGGVCADRVSMYRPAKDSPRALMGEMSWEGSNNGSKVEGKGMTRVKQPRD